MSYGETLPYGVTLKTSALAKADWVDIAGSEQPIYLKATLNGSDEIEKLYACFEKNDTQYCLSGEGSSTTILNNAKIIYDAFEGQGCEIDYTPLTEPYSASYIPNPTYSFVCGSPDYFAEVSIDNSINNVMYRVQASTENGTSTCNAHSTYASNCYFSTHAGGGAVFQ